jgi:hypothetical protein
VVVDRVLRLDEEGGLQVFRGEHLECFGLQSLILK